ncbi:MAG: DUF1501 domain-containing protein [Acidobacteria bacterium]|nr:DUF1501 domain-containing protein [Acidobacteriota bacterium]
MSQQDRFDRMVDKHPHRHDFFFARPHWNRRGFFRMLGAGLAGTVLLEKPAIGQVIKRNGAESINRAKYLLMILLSGAPSHTDTFDFKQSPSTPMDLLKPETINGIAFPTGLMPKLAAAIPDYAIIRSARSWALQHNLGQAWVQIGRSPGAVLGDIAPNIGSIVAAEKESEKTPTQVFPTFLALNSDGAVGSGYLSATYAPLRVIPATAGLPDTVNPDGNARFDAKFDFLSKLDGSLRVNSPYGKALEDFDRFYAEGKGLMFNPTVDRAFRFTQAEAAQYGNTNFGNACLLASKILAERNGTRYIQITLGGWDHHRNIYQANSLPTRCRELDNGLGTLIAELKKSGVFDETLIVMMGEFGRTTGAITAQAGRDHFLQQFVFMAGAGIKGGRTIGSTNATGSATAETGWSRDRDIRPEDIEATIYSAMGIDYTSVRYDDPFGRGFYYVPESDKDIYAPVKELWG